MKLTSIQIVPLLALITYSSLSARIWTSTAGVKIEAKYISSTDTTVTIQRDKDFRRFEIPLDKLSADDQQWLIDKALSAPSDTPDIFKGIPKKLIPILQNRGEIILEDDFNREDPDDVEELGENWKSNSKRHSNGVKQCDFVDNAMVLTPAPKATHGIAFFHNTKEPYKDAISWTRAKIPKGHSIRISFDDRGYKPVHAGHINAVIVDETSALLNDEKNGRFGPLGMSLFGNPSKREEWLELYAKTVKKFPTKVKADQWFDLVTHHEGDTLTVYIDGSEIGSFTSPGFGHDTKRRFNYATSNKISIDHVRLWALEPLPSTEE